jgi:asparagine synthase (glutamine-hydrolysing)
MLKSRIFLKEGTAMCGICGFTGNIDNREEVLTRMMNRIIHRGPDSGGQHISDGIAMGFRRLAIIDLNNGNQPMYNEDRTLVVTFNGEIYNYRELRKELEEKGHIFSNNADTEVLLHGYEEYGAGLVEKLRGMFTFVLWDMKTKTLFGARDHFGIKPFYYAPLGNDIVYGSEIKSILEHPSYQKKVNPEALENYLTFQYSVLPETFFKGIFKLPPAHYFTFKNGDLKITRYFDPSFAPDDSLKFEDVVNRIDETMQESVRAHMLADVEVGSFLSSGVDSSYVAASFHGDKTFTVGFDYEKYNETEYAKDLSSKIGIENYGRIISTEEYWNVLPKIQYHMDEPLADPSAVALYFVSETASKHVKVALSGEGADEFFGGYNIYHEPFSLGGYQKLPEGLRKGLAAAAKAVPFRFKGKNFLIRGSKSLEERFIGNAFMFSEEERAKILKNPTGLYSHKYLTKPFYKKAAGFDDVTKMQYIDVNFWLIGDILLKADKMSMANSLEVRVPFLDRNVFDLARTLPTKFKVNDRNTKIAMRAAAHRHLPESVAEKKKLGFPVPIRIWLKEEKYYNIIKAAFTGNAAESFFNTSEILKLLDDHRAGKADNSRKIWTIYMFLVWYKEFFE